MHLQASSASPCLAPLLPGNTNEHWRNKYGTVGLKMEKEGEEVHSVQGPLPIEINACEADFCLLYDPLLPPLDD